MEQTKNIGFRLISFKKSKGLISLLMVAFFFDFLFFAMPVLADEAVAAEKNGIMAAAVEAAEPKFNGSLPKNGIWEVKYATERVITAYNSEPGQCDDSPCITANGFNLCEHNQEDSIAANFLKFGTKVRIPDLYGDKVFVVRDRMNARHAEKVDIWMKEKQDARKFGVKVAKLEILE